MHEDGLHMLPWFSHEPIKISFVKVACETMVRCGQMAVMVVKWC